MKSESEHDLFYTWIKNWIPKFEAVIEIGVATGGSTKVWHSFLDKDGIFIGIDINLVDPSQNLFGEVEKVIKFYKDDPRMYFILGDSMEQSTVDEVRNILNGRKVDVLWIDGEHSPIAALSDYNLYVEFVKPEGVIAWHDATKNTNVRNVIDELIKPYATRHKYGAVWDLKDSPFQFYCQFDSSTGHCGIRALVRK